MHAVFIFDSFSNNDTIGQNLCPMKKILCILMCLSFAVSAHDGGSNPVVKEASYVAFHNAYKDSSIIGETLCSHEVIAYSTVSFKSMSFQKARALADVYVNVRPESFRMDPDLVHVIVIPGDSVIAFYFEDELWHVKVERGLSFTTPTKIVICDLCE